MSDIIVGFKFLTLGEKDLLTYLGKKKFSIKQTRKKMDYVAPSSIKKDLGWPTPKELSLKNIKELKNDFKNCAVRAKRIDLIV